MDEQAQVVQPYEIDAFLIEEVSRFMGMALAAGESCVVIATEAHRKDIEGSLQVRGLDVDQAAAEGRYVALDAAETVCKFMTGGTPDDERFNEVIWGTIARAKSAAWSTSGRVTAFGEMVALLWAEGKHEAAVRLEQLWNGLSEVHGLSLRCAYPPKGFAHKDEGEASLRICAEHSSVVPQESYLTPIAEQEKHRTIAHLQQKAPTLEAESASHRSEERFRLLVEGVEDYAIYALDPSGVITSWNEGAKRIKGYTADEIIGQNFERFYTPEDRERGLPAKVLETAIEEGHYEGEGWRVRKNGTRFWSNVVVTPLRNKQGVMIGFSKITRDMTERKQLLERIQQHAEKLEKTQESLRRLSGQLLRVQDEERRRLARELHDGVGQLLAALNMNLELLQDAIKDHLPRNLSQKLAESIRLADQIIKETRTLSYLLHPPLLDEAGLLDALEWFVSGFIERSGIGVSLEVAPDFPRLRPELETAIFRIIQEALTNIHRHSGSPTAKIYLNLSPGEIQLVISDQGKGLDNANSAGLPENGKGLGVGIAGMRERVFEMGGRFEIAAGHPGTVIKTVFPCRMQPEQDRFSVPASRRAAPDPLTAE